eukprot:Em0004g1336a
MVNSINTVPQLEQQVSIQGQDFIFEVDTGVADNFCSHDFCVKLGKPSLKPPTCLYEVANGQSLTPWNDLNQAYDAGIAKGVWKPIQFNGYEKIRVCGDYSVTVNSQLETHRYPMRLPDDLMQKLSGGYGFSKIDLADEYNQIKLGPERSHGQTDNRPQWCHRFKPSPKPSGSIFKLEQFYSTTMEMTALQEFLMQYGLPSDSPGSGIFLKRVPQQSPNKEQIDFLLPSPAHIFQGRQTREATKSQAEEINDQPATVHHIFKVGTPYYALYWGPRRDKDPSWVPAVVTKVFETRSVNVQVFPKGDADPGEPPTFSSPTLETANQPQRWIWTPPSQKREPRQQLQFPVRPHDLSKRSLLVTLVFLMVQSGNPRRSIQSAGAEDADILFVDELRALMKATLTWHAGTIPGNEIWLKLGGDKGDGYFKMNFQIINTQAPNSAHNTCVFCDTLTNLNHIWGSHEENCKDAFPRGPHGGVDVNTPNRLWLNVKVVVPAILEVVVVAMLEVVVVAMLEVVVVAMLEVVVVAVLEVVVVAMLEVVVVAVPGVHYCTMVRFVQ